MVEVREGLEQQSQAAHAHSGGCRGPAAQPWAWGSRRVLGTAGRLRLVAGSQHCLQVALDEYAKGHLITIKLGCPALAGVQQSRQELMAYYCVYVWASAGH